MSEEPQKIVALVDGSAYSASVCDHAAWLSGRTGAPVELIHVLGRREAPERPDLSGAIALGARTALLEELAELDARRAKLAGHRGRAILEDARAILDKAGVAEVTTRLRHGGLIEALAEVEADARVIMIGKRGEAADFARGHLGSNLERVARVSRRPVFVASRAFRPIYRVLVAWDGGASAVKAVDHIARSPLFQGLDIHVVTVGSATPEALNGLAHAKLPCGTPGSWPRPRSCRGSRKPRLASWWMRRPSTCWSWGLRPFAHPQPDHRLHHHRHDPILQGVRPPDALTSFRRHPPASARGGGGIRTGLQCGPPHPDGRFTLPPPEAGKPGPSKGCDCNAASRHHERCGAVPEWHGYHPRHFNLR